MPSETITSTVPPHEVYTVKERVAIGTAGVVYRGQHCKSESDVTFKVLSPKATHPLETARLLALRWRLDALKHPVIAEILDAYDDPEGFVIVSTWLPGARGGNEFPRKLRTLTKAEAHLVAQRLCQALLAGEQQRFPHGDLKPSNVILADRGPQGMEVQIQDWGISACRELQPPETLQFMAPERHHGHPPSVQSDLFNAAASLWYFLTADAPVYGSDSEQLLVEWGAFDSASLAEKRPDLDDHFRQWLAWLLRWQPSDRPASVSQALDVLNQVVNYAAALEAKEKAVRESAAIPVIAAAATEAVPVAQVASAKPAPARPGAPRAKNPRIYLPVSPEPPISTISNAKPKGSGAQGKTPKPKANVGQRVMATIMALCIIAGLGVAFVAWAENQYGHDWKKQMARQWNDLAASKAASTSATETTSPQAQASPAPSATPSPATASAVSKLKISPAEPGAVVSAPKPASKAAKSQKGRLLAMDSLSGTGDLQGRSEGSGWKEPWKASLVTLKKKGIEMGKDGSSASRSLGPLKDLPSDFLCVSLLVAHPGKGATPLKVDILSTDGKTPLAPVCVAVEDDKVKVFIEGAEKKIEAPSDKPFRLLVRWDWTSKRADAKKQVTVSAMVDPPLDLKKIQGSPISRRSFPQEKLPQDAVLLLNSSGGEKSVTIADVRVARHFRDAVPR